jgi:hypothetical protein
VLRSLTTVAVEHSRSCTYRLSTTTCMSRSPGVDSLRSEPCGFEAPFSKHDTVCRLPRISLPRTRVNKGKEKGRSIAERVSSAGTAGCCAISDPFCDGPNATPEPVARTC